MTGVVICGALGRMGGTVARLVHESPDLDLIGGIDIRKGEIYGAPIVSTGEIDDLLKRTRPDVLVDFTIAAAAVENVKAASRHGTAVVVGTTGFSPVQRDDLRQTIEGRIPAVISSNFSVGVNIFLHLVREAARKLPDYDIEVIEAHHRYKKDAPSGTAKMIIEALESELGQREKLYGREGIKERGSEIGVHVIRGGDIVGDHSVLFARNFECIELSHRAYDRAVFASGAVKAIRWVVGKKPGIYSMANVLGI